MIGRLARKPRLLVAATLTLTGMASAAVIWMTFEDFHLPGTQVGDLAANVLQPPDVCANCHAYYDNDVEPFSNWSGSLMGLAGRDPLFFAQMTNANQDVANVGYFCLRCHVPNSFVDGTAYQPDGSTLTDLDREGVMCHFCHALVDPIYVPGVSPREDQAILAAMPEVPTHYGNAMFVLDPNGTRRGPRRDGDLAHEVLPSAFHRSGDLCGTCHDVGNVAATRQADGTYAYNQVGRPTPVEDLHGQFPLERTYTEWKLSAFANGGVDMHGRFGGTYLGPTGTCQDCHMPAAVGQACYYGPVRPDVRRHSFAGAAAQVLDLILEANRGDQNLDRRAIQRGRERAVEMLEKAATLQLSQSGGSLRVRVVNETGHKLPTGHIEGRRAWIGVRMFDANGHLLREFGNYDTAQAVLDESSTRIYEMRVGLSPDAAAATGLPAGPTGHMSLANTIEKDNRIPPRGFSNALYAMAGAPVVGAEYADGQFWDDAWYTIPEGATRVTVALEYQNTPRHYIEELRDNNHSDTRGRELYDLWERTGKGAPIEMARAERGLAPFVGGDLNGDCAVTAADLVLCLPLIGSDWTQAAFVPQADVDGDHRVTRADLALIAARQGLHCP